MNLLIYRGPDQVQIRSRSKTLKIGTSRAIGTTGNTSYDNGICIRPTVFILFISTYISRSLKTEKVRSKFEIWSSYTSYGTVSHLRINQYEIVILQIVVGIRPAERDCNKIWKSKFGVEHKKK